MIGFSNVTVVDMIMHLHVEFLKDGYILTHLR